jgi:hypothetical protein
MTVFFMYTPGYILVLVTQCGKRLLLTRIQF